MAVVAASCRLGTVNPGTAGSAATAATPVAPNTNAEANRAFVAAALKQIEGREKLPAESVFTNLQIPWLGKTEAETFLSIMKVGYAQALGVSCSYCHVEGNFASDAKRPKRAAREMAVMHRMINTELQKMQHVPTRAREDRAISCITCHRGARRPPD